MFIRILLPLYTVLLIFFFLPALAQTAEIKGKVLDSYDNPVAGASVSLLNRRFETFTTVDGSFLLKEIPFGEYEITIQEEDYSTFVQAIKIESASLDLGVLPLQTSIGSDKTGEIPAVTLDDDVTESTPGTNVSGVLTASRDVFAFAAAYTFSAGRFKIRGYENNNFVTLMNGIPVVDLTTGNTMFYLWGGLNDVVRSRDNSTGLAAAVYDFGGIGGATYIDSRATKQRKQLQVSYSASNRAYENRLMLTYGSGIKTGGWSYAVSASRRWAQEGYIPGTFYDGISYFGSIEKIIGTKHSISLTAFGTPTKRGKAAPSVQEMYDIAGTNYYNPNWGYQNGEKRNAAVNTTHMPVAILMHDWKINDKTSLKTSAGYIFGKNINSALDWYNAPDPRPDFYRNLPGYSDDPILAAQAAELLKNNEELRQLNWEHFYQSNNSNIVTIQNVNGIAGNNVTGKRANYIIEDRIADHKIITVNSNLLTSISDVTELYGGISYQKQNTNYYKEVNDLLGADFYVDLNQYAEQDFPDDPNAIQNDLNNPNRIVKEGDRFGYDYEADINKGMIWLQPVFKFNKVDLFVSGQLTSTTFSRTGNVKNGLFPETSFGDSEKLDFFNYAAKGGTTYKINGRNFIVANAGYLTKAPEFQDAFISVRTRSQTVEKLSDEKIFAAEGGYLLKAPKMKLKAFVYLTDFSDQTKTVSFYHGDFRTFVNYTLSGIDTRHVGTELAAEFSVYKGVTVSGVAALGQYYYTSRPNAIVSADNNAGLLQSDETIYIKNFRVPGTPQNAYSLGLGYRAPQFWFINLSFNYFDEMWLEFNPTRRTTEAVDLLDTEGELFDEIISQQKLDPQFTIDFFGGKSWKLNNQFQSLKRNTFLVLNLGVNNILNNEEFITGGYEQLRFDFQEQNPNRFAPKYFYGFGTNFFANLTLRFN